MQLFDLLPDPVVVATLEPSELGLHILRVLADRGPDNHGLGPFLELIRRDYSGTHTDEVSMAVREAWAWLEGAALLIPSIRFVGQHDMRALSRAALRLVKSPAARAIQARSLVKEHLHPAIREDAWALFHRGKFDTAVFEAMKAVEVAVREAAGMSDKDLGVPLMRKAFDKNIGPLTDMEMDEGEREARAHLFAGAIGSYKNPHSHRNVSLDDADEAAEIILIASHLLRIVDARRPPR
jgi:uncharacterized protein (TIGR02391 family)